MKFYSLQKTTAMKSLLLTFFLAFTWSITDTKAQDPVKIKQQATIMANAFFKGDLNTLMDYTYPKVLARSGGKAKMMASIKKGLEEMKAAGTSFRSVTLGSVSKVYKAGTELHCTIPQHSSMNVPGGYVTSTSPLMGISGDGGKTWTFISAGNMGKAELKQLFPKFNHDLVLEKASTPVFHKE